MTQITMDVFKQDAFSAQNLTAGIDKNSYVPNLLGSIPGLFVPPPLGQPRSKWIFVEERLNLPAIIQTSPRGSEPSDGRTTETTRKVRPFEVPRLFRKRRIMATEIAGIRAYGSVTEMDTLQQMVSDRQANMQSDFSLTWEHMRLGAVQGSTLDADGTVIYDWATSFGQSIPSPVTWTFPALNSANDGSVATLCAAAYRSIKRALKGLGGDNVTVHAIAGDAFYDALRACSEVRETFKYTDGGALRELRAWLTLDYAGIRFYNYRGTDDQSTVAVATDTCKFFPVGAGIFQSVYAPADERFEFVDSPGQEAYSWVVTDYQRNEWVDVEMKSYPLMMCVQPSALYSAQISS